MGIYEDFLKILGDAAYGQYKNPSQMAEHLGVEPNLITRWLKKERVPKVDKMGEVLDALGVTFSQPGPTETREVCFVKAKVVPLGEGLHPPQEQDYMAVPLVDEVGAGPGYVPQNDLLSWFLVYKHQDAIKNHSNLIAVQIGKSSTSMLPLLSPGDVVLVNMDDTDVSKPGRIMLVKDPDGNGMIKRVAVEPEKGDYRITFYSDNAAKNPPEVYSWREKYFKDWSRAIAGHVVWAWSDISKR